MFKEQIIKALETVVGELELESASPVQVERPRDTSHGDFSSNIALVLARTAGVAPRALAERIMEALGATDFAFDMELAGPGFINFKVSTEHMAMALADLLTQGTDVGRSDLGGGRKIQVEYVSANPTGPLNIANARAAAYGSTLAAILRHIGFDAQSEFYVNDAGQQVEMLGASLQARLREQRGESVVFPAEGYHGDYVRRMAAEIPEREADAYLALPEREMRRTLGAWGVERILRLQQTDLERFGVSYERWFRETELHADSSVQATLYELEKLGHIQDQEGARYFRSTKWGDDKDRVVVRSDGRPTYFLADAAYHRNKHARGFQKVINVWGPDHHGHVVRMQALTQALGYGDDWLEVVIVQWVKFIENGESVKMSKRAGQLVTLADLLDEVGTEVAKYFFLMRQQNSHLDFDLDLAKRQSDENPVYYVKYAHARICSVIRKAAAQDWILQVQEPLKDVDAEKAGRTPEETSLARLDTPEEHQLIQLLLEYPDFLRRAGLAREPHRLTGYCEDLARAFHKFYHEHRIIQEDQELGLARLALCHATRRVLASALGLMSISVPQSM